MQVFLTAYCARCLLRPSSIALWVRSDMEGGGEKGKSLLLPSLSVAECCFYTQLLKSLFPSSEASLQQLVAKEMRAYASWSSSGTEREISRHLKSCGLHSSVDMASCCMAKDVVFLAN